MNKTTKNLLDLMDQDYLSFSRIVLIRLMMEHRGITTHDVAEYLGKYPGWVARVTGGRLLYWKHPESRTKAILEVEDAITGITEQRGGLPYACSCTLAGYVELANQLKEA